MPFQNTVWESIKIFKKTENWFNYYLMNYCMLVLVVCCCGGVLFVCGVLLFCCVLFVSCGDFCVFFGILYVCLFCLLQSFLSLFLPF